MFEYFYIARALEILKAQQPKVIAVVGASYLAWQIQENVTKVKMQKIKADADLRVAEIKLETARINNETAKMEAAAAQPRDALA